MNINLYVGYLLDSTLYEIPMNIRLYARWQTWCERRLPNTFHMSRRQQIELILSEVKQRHFTSRVALIRLTPNERPTDTMLKVIISKRLDLDAWERRQRTLFVRFIFVSWKTSRIGGEKFPAQTIYVPTTSIGSGSAGRVVASDFRGQRFESSHRQNLY